MTSRSCWPPSTTPTTEKRRRRAQVTGVDPWDQLAVIDASEAAIGEAGVNPHSHTSPGNGHGIFEWPRFYEIEVNGERLVDWVTRLIEGKSVDDVHCQKCRVS